MDPLILAAVHRLLAQGRPQQQVVTVVVWEEDVARLRCLGWVPEAVGSIAVQRVHHSVGGEDVEGRPAANIVLEALRDGPIHPEHVVMSIDGGSHAGATEDAPIAHHGTAGATCGQRADVKEQRAARGVEEGQG